MRKLVAITAFALALTGCSTVPKDLADAKTAVITFTRADVQRGLEIATVSDDAAGVACATAILKHMPDTSTATMTPAGAFSLFMKGREVRRGIGQGMNDEVHNACAPLVLDAEVTLAKLGLIAVPGGGAAGTLLGR